MGTSLRYLAFTLKLETVICEYKMDALRPETSLPFISKTKQEPISDDRNICFIFKNFEHGDAANFSYRLIAVEFRETLL